jgi:hypothetical protein
VRVDERFFLLGVRGVFAPVVTGFPGEPWVRDQLPGMTQRRVIDFDGHRVVSALS